MKRIYLGIVLTISCINCRHPVTLNETDIETWQQMDLEKLYTCCAEFDYSVEEIMLKKRFKDRVRARLLAEIPLYTASSVLEFIEYYEHSTVDVTVYQEQGDVFTYRYNPGTDALVLQHKAVADAAVIAQKEEIINEFETAPSGCCDLSIPHAVIGIYTKVKIDDNHLEVLRSLIH